MKKLNLQQFTGSSLTVYNDGNFSATTASPSSSLAKGDKSTLTITPSTGYELDEIEVITGGCTVAYETSAWKVTMDETDAIIFVKGKKNNVYKVLETTPYWVNGTKGTLAKNVKLIANDCGDVYDVSDGGEVSSSVPADVLAQLVADGKAVKV